MIDLLVIGAGLTGLVAALRLSLIHISDPTRPH